MKSGKYIIYFDFFLIFEDVFDQNQCQIPNQCDVMKNKLKLITENLGKAAFLDLRNIVNIITWMSSDLVLKKQLL